METKIERKAYRKPTVVTEKIFEQAALACSAADMGTPATAFRNSLKNNITSCEFSHS